MRLWFQRLAVIEYGATAGLVRSGVGVRRKNPPRLDEGADLSSSLRTVEVVFWLVDDAGSIDYDGKARRSMRVVSWDKIDKQE
jgi:hypothetical protein